MESNKQPTNPDIAWLQSLKTLEQHLFEQKSAKLDTQFTTAKCIGPEEYMPYRVRVTSSLQQVYEYNPLLMTPYGVFCTVSEVHEAGMGFVLFRSALLSATKVQEEDEAKIDYMQFLAESVSGHCGMQKGHFNQDPIIAAFAQFIEGAQLCYYQACTRDLLETFKENEIFTDDDTYVINLSSQGQIYTYDIDRTPIISRDTIQKVSLYDANGAKLR